MFFRGSLFEGNQLLFGKKLQQRILHKRSNGGGLQVQRRIQRRRLQWRCKSLNQSLTINSPVVHHTVARKKRWRRQFCSFVANLMFFFSWREILISCFNGIQILRFAWADERLKRDEPWTDSLILKVKITFPLAGSLRRPYRTECRQRSPQQKRYIGTMEIQRRSWYHLQRGVRTIIFHTT